jgi:glycosyltransferase involved in cell wall biosynthesis
MRILILTQYFWPESFKINDLALALKERGHEVTIFTGKPNYPKGKFMEGYSFFNKRSEYWNDIKVYRAPLVPRGNGKGIQLFVNYISFAIFASIRLLFIRNRFDKIFVYEPSPITVGIPGIVAKYKFKAPIYFWVQDLWPASISAAGGVQNKSVLFVLNWLTQYIYKHSKKVLVQSKAFIPYIINQNVDPKKLVYLPNTVENYYQKIHIDQNLLKLLPQGFKLMFAGNIGESQSFDTLLNAASILKQQGVKIQWLVLGDGRMRESVLKKVDKLNLHDTFHLLGSHPSREMPKFFSCADALIVSLKRDPVFSLTIPSKIQAYLACGKPLIVSLDGEGAKIVEEAQCGLTCPAEDSNILVVKIKEFLMLSSKDREQMGFNARLFFEKEFAEHRILDKLENILID